MSPSKIAHALNDFSAALSSAAPISVSELPIRIDPRTQADGRKRGEQTSQCLAICAGGLSELVERSGRRHVTARQYRVRPRHTIHGRHTMRLYQVKSLRAAAEEDINSSQSLALLRVADVDKFGDLADPYSLLGDARFQFLGGPAENFMPARLQFAANVRLLTRSQRRRWQSDFVRRR